MYSVNVKLLILFIVQVFISCAKNIFLPSWFSCRSLLGFWVNFLRDVWKGQTLAEQSVGFILQHLFHWSFIAQLTILPFCAYRCWLGCVAPVKIVPEMTNYVSRRTLNHTHSLRACMDLSAYELQNSLCSDIVRARFEPHNCF